MDKIKQWFKEFTEPIVERITAPLGVTFILVWVVHNWKLVFSLLNLDKDTSLAAKLLIIQTEDNSGYCWYLSNDFVWYPIGKLFVALASYYILSTLVLAMVTVYKRWMKPLVFNVLDQSSNVTKADLDRLKINYSQVKSRETDLENKISDLEDYRRQTTKLVDENDLLSKEHERLKKGFKFEKDTNLRLITNAKSADNNLQNTSEENTKLKFNIENLQKEISNKEKIPLEWQLEFDEVDRLVQKRDWAIMMSLAVTGRGYDSADPDQIKDLELFKKYSIVHTKYTDRKLRQVFSFTKKGIYFMEKKLIQTQRLDN